MVTRKKRIEEFETAAATETCLALMHNKVPAKKTDPGSFTIECLIGHNYPTKALCDPGASINLMPKSVFQKLGIREAKPTTVMLQLADHSYVQPEGKIEDILADQEEKLIATLRQHKEALGWTIADIKGISPTICIHKILLDDDHKPTVDAQRRLNQAMKDVVRKEMLKWLDPGIIYPISDSEWVSPVQCVPKKGGITVISNEKNELIPTRTVTGWRVCMDYRQLNKATRKDHFPLPFIDQMLDRLAEKQFYCFLDGYSGYNQIAIAPEDQSKTTLTFPYGTFAFRRTPFGLCNAPATFQRCMTAIFSDLNEDYLEIFMDDFSTFGDNFDNCLNNLEKILKRCKETNLVLNWEKCHFMIDEGIVLGHKISSKGILGGTAGVALDSFVDCLLAALVGCLSSRSCRRGSFPKALGHGHHWGFVSPCSSCAILYPRSGLLAGLLDCFDRLPSSVDCFAWLPSSLSCYTSPFASAFFLRVTPANLVTVVIFIVEECQGASPCGCAEGPPLITTHALGSFGKRLDRFIADSDWFLTFPTFRAWSEYSSNSDHHFILLDTVAPLHGPEARGQDPTFRFDECWAREPECISMVQSLWAHSTGPFPDRLATICEGLRHWQNTKRTTDWEHIPRLRSDINRLSSRRLNAQGLETLLAAKGELSHLLKIKEAYWAQRSRVLWLSAGDQNTSFFHAKASAQKKKECDFGPL
ncbi:hypothetical protein GQ457_06G015160 [Hibiscus cannabinus]